MSYLRYGYGLCHVVSASKDYIFQHSDGEDGSKDYIEDYGGISNEGITELCCDALEEYFKHDELIKDYLKHALAERLGVKLREKQLSYDESLDILMAKSCPICLSKNIITKPYEGSVEFVKCNVCGYLKQEEGLLKEAVRK